MGASPMGALRNVPGSRGGSGGQGATRVATVFKVNYSSV